MLLSYHSLGDVTRPEGLLPGSHEYPHKSLYCRHAYPTLELHACLQLLTKQMLADMYGGTDEDFQKRMKPFIQNAPLMAARPGIDDEKYIKDVDRTGGRLGYDYEIAGKCTLNPFVSSLLGGSVDEFPGLEPTGFISCSPDMSCECRILIQ